MRKPRGELTKGQGPHQNDGAADDPEADRRTGDARAPIKSAGVRKMPTPMAWPTTRAVAGHRPSSRAADSLCTIELGACHKNRQGVVITLTAEAAETAERNPREILGDLCALCG